MRTTGTINGCLHACMHVYTRLTLSDAAIIARKYVGNLPALNAQLRKKYGKDLLDDAAPQSNGSSPLELPPIGTLVVLDIPTKPKFHKRTASVHPPATLHSAAPPRTAPRRAVPRSAAPRSAAPRAARIGGKHTNVRQGRCHIGSDRFVVSRAAR